VKIEISNGELVDKVTILHIKREKMSDAAKLANIDKEYELLRKAMSNINITVASPEFVRLLEVNLRLWDIEDRIRHKEARQEFNDEFVQLARSIYFENDQRAAIKKEINLKTGSNLMEEKQYVDYQATTR
jgi:hypothetical protein